MDGVSADGVFSNVEKTGVLWAGMFASVALIGGAVGMYVQHRRGKQIWKGALTGAIGGVTMVPVTAIAMGIAATQGWLTR